MISKDKLSLLIENTLLNHGLTMEASELAAHVERIHPELVDTVSYPAWDSKDDILAHIATLILQINQNPEFKEELKSNVIKALKQSLAESRPCWFVGASWEQDQTQRFIEEGIWENGNEDKYLQEVKTIKPGDRIAIKSTYTRKNNLPFANRENNTASVMGIKALVLLLPIRKMESESK